jgi:hypothetical protein
MKDITNFTFNPDAPTTYGRARKKPIKSRYRHAPVNFKLLAAEFARHK